MNVATPAMVVTEFSAGKLPDPEAMVAVIVKLSARLFAAVIGLEKLSCTVTTGGGLKVTAMNLLIGSFVGTSVKAMVLAIP